MREFSVRSGLHHLYIRRISTTEEASGWSRKEWNKKIKRNFARKINPKHAMHEIEMEARTVLFFTCLFALNRGSTAHTECGYEISLQICPMPLASGISPQVEAPYSFSIHVCKSCQNSFSLALRHFPRGIEGEKDILRSRKVHPGWRIITAESDACATRLRRRTGRTSEDQEPRVGTSLQLIQPTKNWRG